MVEEISLMLGAAASNFSEAQIGLAAKMALQYVEDVTGREPEYSMTLLAERIAVLYLNRLGTEGLASQSFNGFSEQFISDLPDDIIRALNRKRKVVLK